MDQHHTVTTAEIADGLARLGLTHESSVVVHASLRSFGTVEGGAAAVVDALTTVCGTVVMMAGSSDLTKLPAPPGLIRPHNAYYNAESWEDFDQAVAAATPYARDASGLWVELPNVTGESHRFDAIEPHLLPATAEVSIGECRARRIPIADVVAATRTMIARDPAALLCDDDACRCVAALRQLQQLRSVLSV